MKILLIGPEWFGGVQHYTYKALNSLKCTVHKINYNYKKAPIFSEEGEGKQYTQSADERKIRALVRKAFPSVSKIKNRFSQGNVDRNIELINKKILEEAKFFKPDLVLVIKGEIIYPETIKKLKDWFKIPICSWWLDSPFIAEGQFPFSLKTISLYDHVFIFDKHYLMSLNELGIQSSYLPNCVDDTVFIKRDLDITEIKTYQSDVAFLGAGYLNRIIIMEKLLDFDLKLWGIGYSPKLTNSQYRLFKYAITERIISPVEASKIYSTAKIMLNFHHHQCFHGPNQKIFEIAACGGFQLAQKLPFIEEMFNIGHDFDCYKSLDDLREKINFYLRNDKTRIDMAKKARKTVLSHHTYSNRMKTLLDIVKTI